MVESLANYPCFLNNEAYNGDRIAGELAKLLCEFSAHLAGEFTMRYAVLTICLFVLATTLGHFCVNADEQDAPADALVVTQPTESTEDELLGKYLDFLKEYRKLLNEFGRVSTRLNSEIQDASRMPLDEFRSGGRERWILANRERWERECYQPLLEKTKKRMAEMIGIDDYLSLWEHGIPQKMSAYLKRPEGKNYGEVHDSFMLNWVRAVLSERKAVILKSTKYENTENGETRIGGWVGIIDGKLDESWYVMAIYSFQNDRARGLLFDMATRCDADEFLSSLAIYYVSLCQNTTELLPKVQCLLEQSQAHELITRLTQLEKSLNFNEKIPVEERERYDAVRRELAISRSSSRTTMRGAPTISVTLRKGEEHFESYLKEYAIPGHAFVVKVEK